MKAMTVVEMNTHLMGLVRNERKMTLEIISYIGLFERCGGPLKMGYASMHDYLTRMLGYSDDQAYRRLKAARLYNQVPEVAEKLKEGSLTLTQAAEAQKSFELAQRETGVPVQIERKKEILNSIAKTTNFQTKAILSEELNLKLLEADIAKPQSDKTVRLEVTLTAEQYEKLKQIKSLLSHQVPSQNTAEVFDILFNQFLGKHVYTNNRSEKVAEVRTEEIQGIQSPEAAEGISSHQSVSMNSEKPSSKRSKLHPDHRSRYISTKIRRSVYQRAQGCCEHVDQNGHRCNSRYQLAIDHKIPFALNGTHELDNLRITCSRHNNYLASQMNLGFEQTSFFIAK